GRLVGVQSRGGDPGMEIIRLVWPDLEPFGDTAAEVVAEARRQLGDTDLEFPTLEPEDAVVRYEMHTMPSESAEHIGTSSVLATWNAAASVAQSDEASLSAAMRSGAWEEATRRVMARHPTVWFEDDVFVISRP